MVRVTPQSSVLRGISDPSIPLQRRKRMEASRLLHVGLKDLVDVWDNSASVYTRISGNFKLRCNSIQRGWGLLDASLRNLNFWQCSTNERLLQKDQIRECTVLLKIAPIRRSSNDVHMLKSRLKL